MALLEEAAAAEKKAVVPTRPPSEAPGARLLPKVPPKRRKAVDFDVVRLTAVAILCVLVIVGLVVAWRAINARWAQLARQLAPQPAVVAQPAEPEDAATPVGTADEGADETAKRPEDEPARLRLDDSPAQVLPVHKPPDTAPDTPQPQLEADTADLPTPAREVIEDLRRRGGQVQIVHDVPGRPMFFVTLVGDKCGDEVIPSLAKLGDIAWLDLERSAITYGAFPALEALHGVRCILLPPDRFSLEQRLNLKVRLDPSDVFPHPMLSDAEDGAPYQSKDPEPTDDETELLEYINYLRNDPDGEAERIVQRLARSGEVASQSLRSIKIDHVDLQVFRDEMRQIDPAPPLVFDLRMIEAARRHVHYLDIHEIGGHTEFQTEPGFSGENPATRLRAVKYPLCTWRECVTQNGVDVEEVYLSYVIDWGPGPGGMRKGREHRANLTSPRMREVGVGTLAREHGIDAKHGLLANDVILGDRPGVARLAGGVVFVDHNGNLLYDAHEGVGGVEIVASNGARTTTWKSGAFALELPDTKPVTLSAQHAGQRYQVVYRAGSENIGFRWVIPPAEALAKLDTLTKAARAAADKPQDEQRRALVALALAARGMVLDVQRSEAIEALTGETAAEMDAACDHVRAAFDEPPDRFEQTVAEVEQPYAGTKLASFFADARRTHKLVADVTRYNGKTQSVTAGQRLRERFRILDELEQARQAISDVAIRVRLAGLEDQLPIVTEGNVDFVVEEQPVRKVLVKLAALFDLKLKAASEVISPVPVTYRASGRSAEFVLDDLTKRLELRYHVERNYLVLQRAP